MCSVYQKVLYFPSFHPGFYCLLLAHPRLEDQPSAESEAKEAKHTSKIPRGKRGYLPHKGPLRTYGDREALKKLAEKKPATKSRLEGEFVLL